jgi:type I restriction enzyme S subunit
MSWKKVKLGDLLIRSKIPVDIEDNKMYKRVTIKTKHQGITVRDIILGSKIGTKKQFILKAGQFVLSKIDAMHGAFGIAPNEVDGAVITGNFWAYDYNKKIVSIEWLNHFINSLEFYDLCRRASTGITHRKYLDEDFFLGYEVYLPDLTEQEKIVHSIVAIKDKINSLNNELSHQLTLLDHLNKAILQEAVQGKLVPQDPNDEPASELLKRIKAEKLKSGKKEKPLPSIKPEEIPFEIPENWVWCRLGEIADSTSGGTPDRSNPNYWNGSISWLKSGELTDGLIQIESEEKITEDGFKNSSAKLFPKGTLLIALYGATAGKLGILNFESTTNQAICGFFENQFYVTKYLFYYLWAVRNKIIEDSWGQAQPNISQSYLKNLLFAFPPLSEQKRIVAEIEKQFTKTKQLKEHILANQQATEQILKALLHEVFNFKEKEEV